MKMGGLEGERGREVIRLRLDFSILCSSLFQIRYESDSFIDIHCYVYIPGLMFGSFQWNHPAWCVVSS